MALRWGQCLRSTHVSWHPQLISCHWGNRPDDAAADQYPVHGE